MNQVKIDTSVYRRSHGAEPRGRGSWAFTMGATDYQFVDQKDAQGRKLVWFAPSSSLFGEAKKLAIAEAKARGVTIIGVCP